MEPRKGHRTVSLSFLILLPQVNKLLPHVLGHSYFLLTFRCNVTEPRKGHRTVSLSFLILLPQDTKSFP